MFFLQKDGFFNIFKAEINYLDFEFKNIDLVLDKIK